MSDKTTTPTERMIAMLQEKIDRLTAERDEARALVRTEQLRYLSEIERLRKELDVARRIETVTDEELQYWHKAVSRAHIEPHKALACRVALGFVEAANSGETPYAVLCKMLGLCGVLGCNEEDGK